MKLKDLMASQVIRISPEETVAVAARMLARSNIGSLPVCGSDGSLKGLVTDRDLVIRCLAAGKQPEKTKVREIMTTGLVCGALEMDSAEAAGLMGSRQIRRLPVVERGRLCGMVSLGDLAKREDSILDAKDALAGISGNISVRD